MSEQWYRNDLEYSIWVSQAYRDWVKCQNADKRNEPRPFGKDGRETVAVLAGRDEHAMKQMASGAGEEHSAGKGDGLEGARVANSLVYDTFKYLNRDVIVIERHRIGGAREV